MAQLTERDKALLQNDIDKIKDDNEVLQEGIDSDTRDLNNLVLYDIPSKKFVDELHFSIFQLEEELRILTGKTIIGPVQENAFAISTTESDVAISILDARFFAKKNGVTFVDIPLIDSRAYVLSAANSNPNFEVWTRDRHGSCTSEKGVQQLYTIHSGNNQLTVTIDGIQKTFNVIDPEILDAQGGSIQNDPLTLSGNISLALENAGFSDAKCFYNSSILTFTIASGTAGPTSTVTVTVASNPDDLAYSMKFLNQVNVPGRFANNKAKIAIDGVEQEITLTFDIRIPVSSSLGLAIDDYSSDWRTNFSEGPMFPAENNNGKKIASLLQNKLREIGSGGFKNAEVVYYSTSGKFLIYSGTFGKNSIVEIKTADADRDFCKYIGLLQPSDQKNKETAYTTLQSLYDYLNSKTVIVCTNLSNPTFPSYSLLSIQKPIIISKIPLYLVTTSEYDRASVSQPRLYSGKLRISNSNNKLDVKEGSTFTVKTITPGDYSEGELCEALTIALNTGSITYSVTYQRSTQKFIISSSSAVTMLFGTGVNISAALTTYIGFTTVDITNTIFTSNIVSFSGVDFYSMAAIPQFVPMSWINNAPPYYYDSVSVKSEQGLTNTELTMLQSEDTSGAGLLNNLKTQIDVSNEMNIYAWENMTTAEIEFINDLIVSIQTAIGLYSATSTTDTNYNNLVTALNNAIAAKNNLLSYLVSHNYILNLRSSTSSYIYGSNFTLGGIQSLVITFTSPNNDRLYNLPAVEFKYADNKYIPMKNSTPIYSNNITFDPFIMDAFSIKSNVTNVNAYVLSNSDANGLFTLQTNNNLLALTINTVDYSIELTTGTNLSGLVVANDIQTKIRALGGLLVNAKVYFNRFDCASNRFKISVGSSVNTSDKTIIVTSSNNKIDFEEVINTQLTATIATGSYNAANFITAVQTAMTAAAGTATYTVSYNATTDKLTLSSNGFKGAVISSSNNKIDFEEITGTQVTATIASGTYNTGAAFAAAIQTALNAVTTVAATYTAAYNSGTDKLTLSSNGFRNVVISSSNNKIDFEEVAGTQITATIASATYNTGAAFATAIQTALNAAAVASIYTVSYNTGTDKLSLSSNGLRNVVITASNNKIDFEEVAGTQITATIVPATYSTGAAFATAIQTALNAEVTVANYTVSYNSVSDKLTITSDGSGGVIFNLKFATGTNTASSAASVMGFAKTDRSSQLSYTSDNTVYRTVFNLKLNTGTNTASSAASVMGFAKTDRSSQLSYTSDNTVIYIAKFTLKFSTGTNTATSAASVMGFIATDRTNLLSHVSDNVVIYSAKFNLKFVTGTNTASSAALIMGFAKTDRLSLLTHTSDNYVGRNSSTELNFLTTTTDVSHVITDTRLTITDTYISTTVYWAGGSIEHLHYNFSVYSNIKSVIDIITEDYPTEYTISIGKSTLWSKYSTKFLVNHGEQFQIQVANGPVQTVTVAAVKASISCAAAIANILVGDTLTFSLNGEPSKTITIPIPINSQTELAFMIQSLVRSIIATNADNQYAYSLFTCTYTSGFTFTCGTGGSGSSISIIGGTLAAKLELSGSSTGTGNVVNNTAVTTVQLVTLLSSFTGVTVSDDSSFLKIQCNNAGDKLQITSNSLSNRIGFFTNNLVSDFANEYANVNCTSIQDINNQSIIATVNVLRGYENRGNISAAFTITDNIRLNARQSFVVSRETYLTIRLSQISSRISTINSTLSPTLYNNRWNEVVKRLNKKTGSYFKVGEKQLAIIRSQQTITENNNRIQQLQTALGG